MSWLIFEALLALGLIVGIMVWTLKTRSDTPLSDDTPAETAEPADGSEPDKGQSGNRPQ